VDLAVYAKSFFLLLLLITLFLSNMGLLLEIKLHTLCVKIFLAIISVSDFVSLATDIITSIIIRQNSICQHK